MSQAQSLDECYLQFLDDTRGVFTQYPQLEAIRHFIFKELLAQRKGVNWVDTAKHWLRPLIQRSRSQGQVEQADVLLWLEGRQEGMEALIPLQQELSLRKIRVQIGDFTGHADPSSLAVNFPYRIRVPGWTTDAWNDLSSAVKDLRSTSIRRSFYQACAYVEALLEELHRILALVNPKIVIATSTQMIGGAALMVASRSRGILTMLLQHGILQPFYLPVPADYMLTWGQSSNDTLVRLGAPADRLVALGSPRHDRMTPSYNGHNKTALLQALALPEKPTFVFFSNGNDLVRNGNAPAECAMWLESAAKEYGERINVVVRLHPNEDGSLYKNCPHLRIIKSVPDLATTLDGCDWVGSLCSTVLYDALIYEKPVWQFYSEGWPKLAENWEHGLAVRISSQAELSQMILHALSESTESLSVGGLCGRVFANHGRATQAVSDFIESSLLN